MGTEKTLKNSSTQTQTQTEVAENPQSTVEDFDYVVDAPLFIKFAEYLGYVSSIVSWCDDLCNGKDIDDFKKKFIEVEAKAMFDEMLNDMTREEIKDYYETFYEVILYQWDDKLQELKQKAKGKEPESRWDN